MLLRILCCAALLTGCQTNLSPPPEWLDAMTFYASFNGTMTADVASGDPVLYTAPYWESIEMASRVTPDNPDVHLARGAGRYGDALRFDSNWNPILFFRAQDNVAYSEENWSGTFSFWLKVVPDEELREGYSDPFIITDRNWDNASLYVDFTEEDRPRHFRFALFPDIEAWNPELIAWDEVPVAERPMIDLEEHPFSSGEWTHVALTFEQVNTAGEPGILTGYLNGEQVGTLSRDDATLSWDVSKTMMAVGRHYRGLFDELSVFDRALTAEEVRALYAFDPANLP